jgi:site-specific DNA recombinase
MRAVIYCRVSDPEQTKNLSLPTQEKVCREYCAREGLEVDRIFIERGESAKTAERTEFRRLLKYCREHKHRVHVVVVYALTRFSRNSADHHMIRALLGGFGISLRSATEPINDSPSGRFVEGVLAAVAQYENEAKAERTLAGMKAAAERGFWIWHPPIGYVGRPRVGSEGPNLMIDPDRAPLVQAAFELIDQGYSQVDVLRMLELRGLRTRRGKPLSKQQLSSLLRNKAYVGVIHCQSWGGVEFKGDFEPLISAELFTRVQWRLLESRRGRADTRRVQHEDFPLRRFARCTICDAPLTASWARGKLGRKYGYYHCRRACLRTTPKGRLETAFVDLTRDLVPSQEYLALVRRLVIEVWREECAGVIERRRTLQRRVDEIRNKSLALEEAFLYQRAIDQRSYIEQRDRIREELLLAEMGLSEAQVDSMDVEGVLASAEEVITNAGSLWLAASAQQREQLQWLLYPEGLKWDGERFQTPLTCLSYYHLAPENLLQYEMG